MKEAVFANASAAARRRSKAVGFSRKKSSSHERYRWASMRRCRMIDDMWKTSREEDGPSPCTVLQPDVHNYRTSCTFYVGGHQCRCRELDDSSRAVIGAAAQKQVGIFPRARLDDWTCYSRALFTSSSANQATHARTTIVVFVAVVVAGANRSLLLWLLHLTRRAPSFSPIRTWVRPATNTTYLHLTRRCTELDSTGPATNSAASPLRCTSRVCDGTKVSTSLHRRFSCRHKRDPTPRYTTLCSSRQTQGRGPKDGDVSASESISQFRRAAPSTICHKARATQTMSNRRLPRPTTMTRNRPKA